LRAVSKLLSASEVTGRLPDPDDGIPLSALQHYLFCARQCALIHVERIWTENVYTAEGRVLHDAVDKQHAESRGGVWTVTAMPLLNAELGITGVADVVEFHRLEGERIEHAYPVEYKRGRPKAHRAGEVQLCAQALRFEFMLKQTNRRRRAVL
jgi:CRISPR-associated exonuclease Cas4